LDQSPIAVAEASPYGVVNPTAPISALSRNTKRIQLMTTLAEPCEYVGADDAASGQEVVTRREHSAAPWRRPKTPIVGNSEALQSVVRQAERVASTDAIVLILGETGTGKELLAQHMHRMSARSAEPFITTNIAAIPATLLESELFGRERGAYTGAMNRQMGRFEVADGATLFLDEIGEMPLETQVKLLRVLENGEFERLGSSRTLRVNVRVIAATNRRFPELLRAGSFRQDLFYRLSVFPLTMPPLRDRLEDIPALVWAFIKEFSYKMGKPIERVRDADLAALQRYHWPGNVRELRNVVERSMILTNGAELRLALPEPEAFGGEVGQASRRLRDVEEAHIVQVLKSTHGRIRGKGGAAEILGLKPTTLYSRMQRLGIERPR
jgi:formate hydrogenlyase transcriptional activator